jgi:predicted nucleotidyltransferase
MRLTTKEKDAISNTAIQVFGISTKVVLFGSRAIDTSRGGDIDLLIIPPVDSVRSEFFDKKIQFIMKVLSSIGDQKIDVIVKYPDDTRGIIQTALNEGVQLC